MKNSEKLKFSIMIILLVIVFIIIGLEATIVVFGIFLILGYLIFNWIINNEFPANNGATEYYKKEAYKYIYESHWFFKLTITYWWNRFIYYLDYELNNKTQNEENK